MVQEEIAEASRVYKLDVLLKELSGAVPGVTEFVRLKVIRYKSEMFDAANETDSEAEDGVDLEMMNALLIGGESKVGAKEFLNINELLLMILFLMHRRARWKRKPRGLSASLLLSTRVES